MRIKEKKAPPPKPKPPLKQPVPAELKRDEALLAKSTVSRSVAVGALIGFAATLVVAGLIYEWMQPVEQAEIVRPELDPDMISAIAMARESFPAFESHYNDPALTQTYFSIKAPYLHGRYLKYVWLEEVNVGETTISGRLVRDGLVRNVEVPRDEIIDWMIVDDGVLLGGYTTRVECGRKTPEERAALEEQYGFRLETGKQRRMNEDEEALVRYLTHATRAVIFTGAGISTASGIPDYRGPQGVWKTRTPVFYQDFMNDEEDRLRYWQQKCEDWEAFGHAEPNAVHQAIATLERAGKLECCITQNVDGLHARAGNSEAHLVELHGTNREAECQTCGARRDAEPLYLAFPTDPVAPLCTCGGLLKPATISFGQGLKPESLARCEQAIMQADLVIALGSTLSVQPAASITLLAAREGIPYIVINQGPTEHDGHPLVTLRMEGDVTVLFPPAVEAACAMMG